MEDEQRETTTPGFDRSSVRLRLIEHVKANKIDIALWVIRLLTIIFTIGYVIPVFGNAQSSYNKVLLANAATAALRLHQRIPTFTFSKEFISRLFMEDSCHYFFYSIIFMSVSPVFPILIPVVLFAILHTSSYCLKLLDLIGQNSCWVARLGISLIEFQTTNILRLAAFVEIILMPMVIIFIFVGKAHLMTPFIYYHFLLMRYMSRRNPYTRNVFSELKMTTDSIAARSPSVVQKLLKGGIKLVTRLAPQPTPN